MNAAFKEALMATAAGLHTGQSRKKAMQLIAALPDAQPPKKLTRDEFAAEAMKAMIGSAEEFTTAYVLQALGLPTVTKYDHEVHYPAFLAKRAYAQADAMLKARVALG